jgi:hypothetical protein
MEERYALRGLSSRATRIRRPRLGAASMKKARSAATTAMGVLGTRPPSVPEPAPGVDCSSSRSRSGVRQLRGAGRALIGCFGFCRLDRLDGVDG